MTDEINEKEIESAELEGFVALDQENLSAIINFDPDDPKFELKRALGLKAALESRGYYGNRKGKVLVFWWASFAP